MVIVAALLLIGSGAGAGILAFKGGSRLPKDLRGVILETPVLLQPVGLTAKSGTLDFPSRTGGRWTFLAMGYTHCPDVCPFILGNLAHVEQVMRKTVAPEQMPQVVFMSVDPDRDHPADLAAYAAYFGDGFVGLTGPKPAIDAMVKQLDATYRFGPKDAEGFYQVFHSAEVYLIDPRGRLYARFTPPIDPARMTADFQRIRQFHDETGS